MQFNSKFNIDDKVYVPQNGLPRKVTIGKIIIEHTDSLGVPGEKTFDNYKQQYNYREKYMCVETGIGSGAVWELDKNIFSTYKDCKEAIMEGTHVGEH